MLRSIVVQRGFFVRSARRRTRAAPFLLAVVSMTAVAACRPGRGAASREQGGGEATERCLSTDASEPAATAVAGRTLRREGVLLRDARRGQGRAVVAVLGGPDGGDVHDPRLARIGARLGGAGVDVVVVVGGLSGASGDLAVWAASVLPPGVPALLVPADTEAPGEFHSAVRALRHARPELFDGAAVRAYLSPDVEVITLPGSPWPTRATGPNCVLDEADARALSASLPRPAAPRLLVSATAPRQQGADATDRGLLGTHVGSIAVASAADALGALGVASLLPRESAGAVAGLANPGDGATPAAGRFAISIGRAGSDPVENFAGELVGPLAWLVRFEPGGAARVERVEP